MEILIRTSIAFVDSKSKTSIVDNENFVDIITENGALCCIDNRDNVFLLDKKYSVSITEYLVNTITSKVTAKVKKEFIITIDCDKVKIKDGAKVTIFGGINPTMKNVIDLLNNNFKKETLYESTKS